MLQIRKNLFLFFQKLKSNCSNEHRWGFKNRCIILQVHKMAAYIQGEGKGLTLGIDGKRAVEVSDTLGAWGVGTIV